MPFTQQDPKNITRLPVHGEEYSGTIDMLGDETHVIRLYPNQDFFLSPRQYTHVRETCVRGDSVVIKMDDDAETIWRIYKYIA